MRRETLAAIVKLRQQAITDAKRQLAIAIADESRAQAKSQEAERQLLREAEAAANVTAGDEVVEAYARWLPTGLQQASAGRLEWEAATVEVNHARATLDAARAAAEMAEDAAGSNGGGGARHAGQRRMRPDLRTGRSARSRLRWQPKCGARSAHDPACCEPPLRRVPDGRIGRATKGSAHTLHRRPRRYRRTKRE